MSPWFSWSLDVLRVVFAAGVALVHLNQGGGFSISAVAPWTGHLGVMGFFVLSGYVISYAVDRKKQTWKEYALARISRIYPVLMGAMIVTYLADRYFHFAYGDWHGIRSLLPSRTPIILTFFNIPSIWTLNETMSPNSPLWSLSYEFFYYVVFGLCYFLPNVRQKIFFTLLACAVVGPKVLLLMPVWLWGVACFHAHRWCEKKNWRLPAPLATIGAIGCLAILPKYINLVGCRPALTTFPLDPWLGYSSAFASDFLYGLLWAVFIFCLAHALPRRAHLPTGLGSVTKFFADFSFSLYAVHYPLYLILHSLWNTPSSSWGYYWLTFGCAVAFAWLFSLCTERKRAPFAAWAGKMLKLS